MPRDDSQPMTHRHSPSRTWVRIAFLAGLLLGGYAQAAIPEGLVPPKAINLPKPVLPSDTAMRDLDVALTLTIGTDGVVTDVSLSQGGGEPFDSIALATAKRFRFKPAQLNGEPVAVTIPYTMRFRVLRRRGRDREASSARYDIEASPGYAFVGDVLEKGTRKALSGITVVLDSPRTGRSWETTTDDTGRFRFFGLPGAKLTLSIPVPEYRTFTKTVRAQAELSPDSRPSELAPSDTFYLQPSRLSRYRSVLRDERKMAAAEITLREEEIKQVPGTFGDPTRVVATLPGVARSPFGLGYYIVRGGNFENTGFLIDGHPAFFLYHLLGGPGVIHPELVGSLTFYPGGYPASYGRFASGAIVLETRDPPRDRWHLDLEFDLFRAAALFSVPFDEERGQVTVSLRRSYFELLLPTLAPDIDLSYLDYQLRVSYEFSSALSWRFYVLGAEDALRQVGASATSGEEADRGFTIGFHRVLNALTWDISKTLRWTNSVIWEFDHTNNRRASSDDDTIDVSLDGWFTQWRSFLTWRPSKRFTLEGGVDALIGVFESGLSIPSLPALGDPRPPIFDPVIINTNIAGDLVSIAPYLMADWEFVEGLRVLPGLRLTIEAYGDDIHLSVDPRLATRWNFSEGWVLKAMIGLAHQPPAPFQVNGPLGDPSIPPVESFQTSFGFELEPSEGWEIGLEGFYNHMDNFAEPADSFSSDGDELDRSIWRSDIQGRAYGLELLIRKRMGERVHGWLSYTLSRAERKRPGETWALYAFDQSHVLNLALSVDLGREWSLGTRFTLATGGPYQPVTGARYDADRDRFEPRFSTITERIETFHRLDLRVDKRWRFDTWMLEAFLDIQNVYNAANPESAKYTYDYSARVDGPSIPILPTLGLRAVF